MFMGRFSRGRRRSSLRG